MVLSVVTIGLLTPVGALIPLGLQGFGLGPRVVWGCTLAVVLNLFQCAQMLAQVVYLRVERSD